MKTIRSRADLPAEKQRELERRDRRQARLAAAQKKFRNADVSKLSAAQKDELLQACAERLGLLETE